jgi:hypothetical protein
MKLPRIRRLGERTRGQAMVEFALILPILILLLLLAVDFGRVFFGWVALNNAARIAANEAGLHPDAWDVTPDATLQALYRQNVIDDMESINCAAPGGGAWTTADIPDPAFRDQAGSFSTDPYEVGDHAQVTLNCEFQFLTPLVGALVGDPMTIAALAEFPVRTGEIDGIPIGGAVPTPTPGSCPGSSAIVPSLVGQTVAAARIAWSGAGFTGAFNPATGSDPDTVTGQTTNPASSPGDCIAKTATVTVTHELACTAPQLVAMKASAGAAAFSAAGFTGTYTINRPPNNDYNIGSQSLVGGQPYVCSSNITVFK